MADVEPELQFGFVPAKVVADLHDIGNWKVGEPAPNAGHRRRLPVPPPCALRVASHVLRRPHPVFSSAMVVYADGAAHHQRAALRCGVAAASVEAEQRVGEGTVDAATRGGDRAAAVECMAPTSHRDAHGASAPG